VITERILNIPTPDSKLIYGKLLGDVPHKPLVVIAHGLTGKADGRLPFNAACYFANQGFNVYRFNFYYHKERARDILDCTLASQADDLDTVVDYFIAQGIKDITVIGHSFGGLTILLSTRQNFNRAVLWEPSHPKVDVFKKAIFNKDLNAFVLKQGTNYLFGRPMVEHYQNLKIDKFVEARKTPTLIASGGASVLAETNKQYYQALEVDKHFFEIAGADHGFTTPGAQTELLDKTLAWLKQL
jgi:dienelactone hydrolase